MENNNRQGCRWEEFIEWCKGQIPDEEEWTMSFAIYTDVIEKAQSLSESIEPCATSSENYWKQRCEHLTETLQAVASKTNHIVLAYGGMIFNNPTADKIINEVANKVDDVCNYAIEQLKSPSPTGDRDCEELKKENARLAEELVKLNKEKNRFKDEATKWLDKSIKLTDQIAALQSQCKEKDQEAGLCKIDLSHKTTLLNSCESQLEKAYESLKEKEKECEELKTVSNSLHGLMLNGEQCGYDKAANEYYQQIEELKAENIKLKEDLLEQLRVNVELTNRISEL